MAGNVYRGLKSSGLHEIAQRVIHIVAFRTNVVAQRRITAEADCANCSSHSAIAAARPSAYATSVALNSAYIGGGSEQSIAPQFREVPDQPRSSRIPQHRKKVTYGAHQDEHVPDEMAVPDAFRRIERNTGRVCQTSGDEPEPARDWHVNPQRSNRD